MERVRKGEGGREKVVAGKRDERGKEERVRKGKEKIG